MSSGGWPVSSGEDLAAALRPRYVEVRAKAGIYYESLYLTAHHPAEPRALWVRHTVLKPPAIHADAEASDGPVWLDAVIGRIRVGPVTTSWIANGAVSIAGRRHRLGGIRFGVGTPVDEHDRGAAVRLRGNDVTVELRAEVDLPRCVAWTYADPKGSTREVVSCSVARTMLHIQPSAGVRLEVTAPVSAFEIGGRRRALDVPLQPFPD